MEKAKRQFAGRIKEMKKFLCTLLAAAIAAGVMSGCTEIPYETPSVSVPENPVESSTSGNVNIDEPPVTDSSVNAIPDKYTEREITINSQEYSEEYQLEEVCENENRTYLMGYTGNGFVQLDTHGYATFTVHVPTTQYYKLTIYMCAFDMGLDVIIGGKKVTVQEGGYETFDGVSKGIIYASDVTRFMGFSLDGIYLKKGDNVITLQSVYGLVYMDKVKLESGRSVSNSFYTMSNSLINPNADINTVKTMNFFSEVYGKKTLSGQRVTPGTNAEIKAVYDLTGRLPAIRVGDLSCAQEGSPYYDSEGKDLQLAKEWAAQGGIVSYGWTWYSPSDSSHYLSTISDFDFSRANTDTDISEASIETIERLYGNGEISAECYRLLLELDKIAAVLGELRDSGVTVLFSPLADAGKGGYWWSESSESYLWLWRTMVNRFNGYYGLTNIIWVWNGGSAEFFPGDKYVDIVGENVFNTTGDSGNMRFMGTVHYNSARAVAMTNCLQIPDPDILAQDNARWLWFSLGGGDCLIDSNGKLTGKYSKNDVIEKAYNHEGIITLDELDI